MSDNDKKQKENGRLIIDDTSELTAKLKEFENKVFLDKIKFLEKYTATIYKEVKEIKQIVSYILLAQEELLNSMNSSSDFVINEEKNTNNPKNDNTKDLIQAEKNKKWN